MQGFVSGRNSDPEYLRALDDVITFHLRMAEATDNTADVIERKYGPDNDKVKTYRMMARNHHDMAVFFEKRKHAK